jgi:hypothetical protein
MTKFIKLTNLIINIKYIQSIVIKPNKYCINMMSNQFDGANWNNPIFGWGTISSYNYVIEVCKTENSSDYKIVSYLIDENKI